MTSEMCCQCECPTGRAGRADDSLYTDNDWGPYCEDCWGDADYWRTLTEENATKVGRLTAANDALATIVEDLIDGQSSFYCEWCETHAEKHKDGGLVGPVRHKIGCPYIEASKAVAAHREGKAG